MKKTLLIGINAKFIHSNLALRYIKKYYANKEGIDCFELLEYSINQEIDFILGEILLKEPCIVTFSCYLWNIKMVRLLSQTIKSLKPEITIIYGGPEVSYTGSIEMKTYNFVDYIIQGEGEEVFRQLYNYLDKKGSMPLTGLVYKDGDKIIEQLPSIGLEMDEIPFPFDDDLSDLANRILYYETSRGCPFRCQYCLSSIEKGVRFKSLPIVYKELDFFLNKKVRQVKLVDRTFNTKKEHALSIMNYIIENDNNYTNFHFEVAPELMTEGFIECLAKARPGLFQLEIGVQSTNSETLHIIKRKNQLDKIEVAVNAVSHLRNTHMHLDLIAGLPKEDYLTFAKSFDYVYSLKPDQLQLGFLKVLKGSGLMEMREKYGIIYRDYPPYEVLQTDSLTFSELEDLKMIEEMVERFYNSGQFLLTMDKLVSYFETPFKCFEAMAKFWKNTNMHQRKHQKLDNYQFIYDFSFSLNRDLNSLKSMIMYDYCFNEKPKKIVDWMDYTLVSGPIQRFLLESLVTNNIWTSESDVYHTKQLSRMYHIDVIKGELPEYLKQVKHLELDHEEYKGHYIIVNYLQRNFIHNNGDMLVVTIK